MPIDGRQSQTALAIARGTARYLHALGYCVVSELPLPSGRRADLVALGGDGEILIVEIKSSVADFRADQKWMDYRLHCDRLFFATIVDVPCKIFPAGRRSHRGRCIRRVDRRRGARASAGRGDAQDSDAALRSRGGAAPAGAGRSAGTLCRRNLTSLRGGGHGFAVGSAAARTNNTTWRTAGKCALISARAWRECAATCGDAC